VTAAQAEDLARQLTSCSSRIRTLFEAGPEERLTHRPRSDAWSAAQCVVHLSLTATAFVPVLQEAVETLRTSGLRRATASRMDWMGRVLRWFLEPPPRFRTRTASPFQVPETGPLPEVLETFLREQQRIEQALRSAVGLDVRACRIVSPFDRRVRYNVLSAFCVLAAHERRHVWQAEQAAAARPPMRT
jgi:hypothetical protein